MNVSLARYANSAASYSLIEEHETTSEIQDRQRGSAFLQRRIARAPTILETAKEELQSTMKNSPPSMKNCKIATLELAPHNDLLNARECQYPGSSSITTCASAGLPRRAEALNLLSSDLGRYWRTFAQHDLIIRPIGSPAMNI